MLRDQLRDNHNPGQYARCMTTPCLLSLGNLIFPNDAAVIRLKQYLARYRDLPGCHVRR